MFELLLDASLVADWRAIVKKETTQDGYVAKNGVRRSGIRGKSYAALRACIHTWLLRVMKHNAAERHRNYLQTQIVMPQRGLEVKIFISRVVELNLYLAILPCLKDVKESPQSLARADVPFSEMELCTIILNAIPYQLACAYWAKHEPNHFPLDVDLLTNELVLLEPQFSKTQQLLEQVRGKKKKNEAAAKAEREAAAAASGDQPKGARNTSRRSSKKQGNKHCERCAKWHPSAKDTHNTNECKRFTASGEDLFKKRQRERSANAHRKSSSEEMAQCFATAQKEQTALLKKLLKTNRKSKKRKIVYASDSDSDSE